MFKFNYLYGTSIIWSLASFTSIHLLWVWEISSIQTKRCCALIFKAVFVLNSSRKDLSACCNMFPNLVYHFNRTSLAIHINICLLLKTGKTKNDVKRKISAGILPISRCLETVGPPCLFSIIPIITNSVLAVMMLQQVAIRMS